MLEQKIPLDHIRHSLAHILASAVLEMFPDAKLGVGPVIETGFYYDFLLPRTLTPEDLKELQKRMRKLVGQKLAFERTEMTTGEAKAFFKERGQPFKVELIQDIEKHGTTKASEILGGTPPPQSSPLKGEEEKIDSPPLVGGVRGGGQKVTLYKTGKFIDLCRGGHVENTSEIDANSFKLDKISGAYWRGDQKNAQLQRVYGLAFSTEDELKAHLTLLAEAEKRDHKKLGRELGLFAFSPLVGPGLPLFLVKGNVLFTELERFMREEKEARGYSFVHIPHIAKTELYKKSGHLGKYDAMMPIMTDEDGDQYVTKAMNCPHHFELYNVQPHSYRDLPYRVAENTTVYRNEKSGELSGLVRVKSLTQDDTHHFVRYDQIEQEIKMILGLMEKVYSVFGFSDFLVQISVRDPKHPEKYFGGDELWKKSEQILIEAVKAWGRPYIVEEGEAAFYGPKIDIMVKDSIGRRWQLTTVQLDFNQPENFHLRYTGEDSKEHAPAVLHVAILGSIERFMGILIEHYAGAFPVWLAPVQVYIGSVGEAHGEAVRALGKKFMEEGIRVEMDDGADTVGYKIRKAEKQKIPYMLIIGDKEKSLRSVTVRIRGQEKQPKMTISAFMKRVKKEISEKQ